MQGGVRWLRCTWGARPLMEQDGRGVQGARSDGRSCFRDGVTPGEGVRAARFQDKRCGDVSTPRLSVASFYFGLFYFIFIILSPGWCHPLLPGVGKKGVTHRHVTLGLPEGEGTRCGGRAAAWVAPEAGACPSAKEVFQVPAWATPWRPCRTPEAGPFRPQRGPRVLPPWCIVSPSFRAF